MSLKFEEKGKKEELENSPQEIQPTPVEASTSSPAPPQYYDSEPSSQPPRYNKLYGEANYTLNSHKPSKPEPRFAGASAATVAAVCAPLPPKETEKNKESRSLLERWKDWKNSREHEGASSEESNARRNIQRPNIYGLMGIPVGRR